MMWVVVCILIVLAFGFGFLVGFAYGEEHKDE